MQQTLVIKTRLRQTVSPSILNFNLQDVDGLFPGFKPGDFAIIHGSQDITSLVTQLCTQAQLTKQLGGLESKVIFIEAGNSPSLSQLSLPNTISMRAYTAYRLTFLITEKLEEAVKISSAKLVVISDIVCSFLNDNVDDQEAKAVYGQIMSYLSGFAKKHRIIIIATCLQHENTRRSNILRELSNSKANTVLRFTKTLYTNEVELEKHPSYMLGVAEFNPENKKSEFSARNEKPKFTLSYSII